MSSHDDDDDDARRALEHELSALGEAEPSPEELGLLRAAAESAPRALAARTAVEPEAHHVELWELVSATRGGALEPSRHEALLERALATATLADEGERALADALRRGLADREGELARPAEGDGAAALVELARALSAAHAPTSLDPARHEALVRAAIARRGASSSGAGGSASVVSLERARARRVRVGLSVAGALALAASVALTLIRKAPEPRTADVEPPATPTAPAPPPVDAKRARSTAELFDAPFARQGGESARIDRIASARASDLRENRYAMWGVR